MPQKTASVAVLAMILSLAGVVSAEASNENRDETHEPTNGLIAFGRFDPSLNDLSLWVATADGSHQKRVTEGPANFSDWSPNGSRIAFDYANESGVHIGTIAPDGSKRRALTDLPGIQEVPKWSPDGRSIVYDAFHFDQDTFSISI